MTFRSGDGVAVNRGVVITGAEALPKRLAATGAIGTELLIARGIVLTGVETTATGLATGVVATDIGANAFIADVPPKGPTGGTYLSLEQPTTASSDITTDPAPTKALPDNNMQFSH